MHRILIYHGGCADGFCAAWLYWVYHGRDSSQVEFIAAHHGDQAPDVSGADVVIVDFSYPRETLLRMHAQANQLVVLDHHKSAENALAGLDFCRFDMSKSGGRMMWEYLYPYLPKSPWIVDYTEDRDLWRWSLPSSREINAAIRSYQMTFELWDNLDRGGDLAMLAAEGAAILRDQAMTVMAKVEQSHVAGVVLGESVSLWRVANATTLISETAEALAKETGVGCCWFELPSGDRVYSLRTVPAPSPLKVDCQAITRLFGGGGHPGAAGFKLAAGSKHPWEEHIAHDVSHFDCSPADSDSGRRPAAQSVGTSHPKAPAVILGPTVRGLADEESGCSVSEGDGGKDSTSGTEEVPGSFIGQFWLFSHWIG